MSRINCCLLVIACWLIDWLVGSINIFITLMASSVKLATALKQRAILTKELSELDDKIQSSLILQVGMKNQ